MHLSVVDCFVITMRACSKENERQGGRSKQKSTLATFPCEGLLTKPDLAFQKKTKDKGEVKTKEHPCNIPRKGLLTKPHLAF